MTTTMVETFDTQMLDFQNDDYSMHVSSSDTWFHDEAIMEDEGLPIDHTNVSIEVDMESYDEDRNTEFEMVDGSENYGLPSTELLDVEVYDASRATTPAAIPAIDTSTIPPSDIGDGSDSPPEIEPPVSGSIPNYTPVPLPTELSEDSVVHVKAHISDTTSNDPPRIQSEEELTEILGVELSDGLVERVLSSNIDSAQDHSAATRTVEDTTVVVEWDSSDFGEPAPPVDDQTKIGDIAQPDCQDLSGSNEGTSSSLITHQANVHDDAQRTEELGDYGSVVSSGDPHEISEGVFIDPPPAVLLSVTPGEQPEISLFNAPPLPEITSSAPSDRQSEIPVLLSHLPILYYEPLSSVFEALRQDDHFANIGESMNTELAFDAYDLDMVLSEDNVYAREVSLHDLNVLHDGLNHTGPLRLRLQMFGPRFIVRYQALQEHVTRLNIPESKDAEAGSPSDTEVKPTHTPQGLEEESLESEELEQNPITYESNQEPIQHEAPQGVNVENCRAVSPAHGQEHYPDDDEDVENHQDFGIGKSDHGNPSDYKEENQEHLDEVGHEGDSALPDHEGDVGHEEGPGPHLGKNNDSNGEVVSDRASGETSESVVRDPLHLPEDERVDLPDASNHTPRISDFYLSASNVTDINQEFAQEIDFRLDGEFSTEKSDSDRPSVEPHLDVDAPVFGANVGHNTDENKNQADSERKEGLTVTDSLDHENVDFDAETWDDDLDGEGDPDLLWEHEQETTSNESSATLSSKTSSKRSISEAELGDDHHHHDDHRDLGSLPYSPGLKRSRVQ
ncbi:hypothetical protein BDZ94DRAFT_1046497 [Collybia nuda]|uniref:Uncharacterized protein n=1 Tax=Collybia nuda TaxID=64659 RepID=A0A9P5XZC4_9AGAR|nr:hypothetical protein BDZ94DRAFT_1046497 [Collybia nuda]